jgi:peptidoglycan/xylan/chitin deacetylase (PgdA/CDA1 family)
MSVDDGHPQDLRMAEMLGSFDIKATFYIPIKNPERNLMQGSEIRSISEHFEIGQHTYNHTPLDGITRTMMVREVVDGKDTMEQLLGKQVISFCYPRGKFNKTAIDVVKNAGFLGARTCMYFLTTFPKNAYLWGVSTHAHYHSMIIQIRHALLEGNFRGLLNFFNIQKGILDWVDQFKLAVNYVERFGGIAHLYLHSWEIDQNHEWNKLRGLLYYLTSKKDLKRVTNGELFKLNAELSRQKDS